MGLHLEKLKAEAKLICGSHSVENQKDFDRQNLKDLAGLQVFKCHPDDKQKTEGLNLAEQKTNRHLGSLKLLQPF